MKIEDGKGKAGDMSVSNSQRGNVSAKTAPRPYYVSRDNGLSFTAIYIFTAAANDKVAYLKNTSSTKNLFIGDVSLGGVNSILWKGWFVSGTAAAGELITPTPSNKSKNIPAEAIAMAGDTTITGLTDISIFTIARSAAADTYEKHIDGMIILGPDDAIMFEYDTGTGGIGEIDIEFHYEIIGES